MDENQKTQQFLNTIKMIESSNGKNFEHPEVKNGIHAGSSAMGNYGMMPNTAIETVGRMKREGLADQDLLNLQTLPPEQIKSFIETNPDKEQQIAEYLAKRVLNKQNGDEERAAYSWLNGHNLTPERLNEIPYKENAYVQKFNKIRNIMGK